MSDREKGKSGSFIAQLRREAGLTQKALAEKLHISDKAVSKWETGMSMPDTALLIPLSDILSVSVTELLLGERIENQLELTSAEDMVKDVINRANSASAEEHAKKMKPLRIFFIVALIIGSALCLLCHILGRLGENGMIVFLMAAFFGLYFSFFAKLSLPDYYDSNRIGSYSHGPVRMNIPGVRFTNGNFPHITRYISLWSSTALFLSPTFMLIFVEQTSILSRALLVLLILASLVLPLYIIGKKHE